MTTIATQRLLLRPPDDGDAPALVRGLNNFNVSQWTARIPYPYGLADAREFLRLTRAAGPGIHRFAIDRGGEAIGVISIEQGEIGYWLAEPHWGQGLGSEAARAVADHGFATLGLAALTAAYEVGNAASRRILLGLGFSELATADGFSRARNAAVTVMRLALAQDAWQRMREQRT